MEGVKAIQLMPSTMRCGCMKRSLCIQIRSEAADILHDTHYSNTARVQGGGLLPTLFASEQKQQARGGCTQPECLRNTITVSLPISFPTEAQQRRALHSVRSGVGRSTRRAIQIDRGERPWQRDRRGDGSIATQTGRGVAVLTRTDHNSFGGL
jgi:hypothetical protein